MLMTSRTKRIEIFGVTISSLNGAHEINAKINKVDRSELLTTSNPNYNKLVRQYKHLKTPSRWMSAIRKATFLYISC